MYKPVKSRLAAIAVTTLFGAVIAQTVHAQTADFRSKTDWNVNIGVGIGVVPVYEGSDETTVIAAPLVTATWRDTISLGAGGFNARLLKSRDFSAGIGLTFDAGRDETGNVFFSSSDDDALRGLG